jgi:hypothetical protein
MGAGKDLFQPGLHLQRMVGLLPPVVKIAGHHHRLTGGQGVDPFGQHRQLRLTMGFAQAEMHAANVNGKSVWAGNAAVEQAAFFALPTETSRFS